MNDLIERLRSVGKDYDFHENALIFEAADEIERLQREVEAAHKIIDRLNKREAERSKHITAMTKDMDSLEKQLEMADEAIERWKAENEELRKTAELTTAYSTELAVIIDRQDHELRRMAGEK